MTDREKLDYIHEFVDMYFEFGGCDFTHPEFSMGAAEQLIIIIDKIADERKECE